MYERTNETSKCDESFEYFLLSFLIEVSKVNLILNLTWGHCLKSKGSASF